jgi:hypothetical protein
MAMSTSTAARVVQVARRIVEQLTQGNTQPDYPKADPQLPSDQLAQRVASNRARL